MCIFATHANAVVISSPKKSKIGKEKKICDTKSARDHA